MPTFNRRSRPVRLGAHAIVLLAIAVAYAPAPRAETTTSSWQIANTSKLDILGTTRTFTARSVTLGPGTPPNNWKTVGTVVLPRVPLAFGQYIDFVQSAPAEGIVNTTTGVVTLALPLRLKDSTSSTQTLTANLTTGVTNGFNSQGSPYCSGTSTDPTYCRGTAINAAGVFRMVAIVNIPVNGGTLGSGALFLLEISGTMTLPCVGTVCTASDSCHLAGTCDPATGLCSNPVAANGAACSDGNACTRSDTCQSGACVGSNPVVCTASGACHVAGTCDSSSGACSSPPAANGATCTDGNACTRIDTCQSGACVGASPVVCTASDGCHLAGVCDPSSGACSNPSAANGASCSDANACTRTDTCASGACVGANPVVCAALDACHAVGTCTPTTGACTSPARTDGTSCDDGNPCTSPDTCANGVCASGPIATPEEVDSGVRVNRNGDAARIVWNPPPRAGSYDVARGSLGLFPVGAPSGETCLVSGLTGTETADGAAPPLGSGYWYLVRSQSTCGQGPYGYEGLRGTPAAPRSTEVCAGPCRIASDCPGSDSECSVRVCTSAVCERSYASSGVATSAQTPGDCRRSVCDGAGGVTSLVDDGDLPADSNPCTNDICIAGTPGHPPAPARTPCSEGGGTVCNGAGACTQCVVAADCTGTDTACRTRACGATAPNTCGYSYAVSGTPATQIAGDCRRSVCDGAGGLTSVVDNTDLPVDGSACTNDVCTAGTPSNPPRAAGTACPLGTATGICDGAGSCVSCGNNGQRCCVAYPTCRGGLTCRSGYCR